MIRLVLTAALVGAWSAPTFAEDPPLSHYYGFLSPEIYKLEQRTANLLVVDINHDGKDDIVVVNNLKNQIDVLLQPKDPKDGATPVVGQEVNEILSSSRMIARKIPLQRPVSSLVVKDVNGDGRPDLVYVGAEPMGLYVEYQDADGNFSEKRSFEIEDASTGSWAVDVGDVNGDGRDDIVFLGKEYIYVLYQTADHRLEDPKKFRISANNPSLLRVLDLDEDGRADVIYITDDPQFPVRVRFQNKQGRLGPERQIEIEKPMSVAYGKLDPTKPGRNMLTISQTTNRMLVYGLAEAKKKEGRPVAQVTTYPFEKTGAAPNVDLTIGDFDADGKIDVAVSDPAGARVVLYRQSESEGLDLGQAYPTMLGTSVLRTLDIEGNKRAQLLSLSTNEKAIGFSRWEGGRLTFPQTLPIKDEPVAIEVAGAGEKTRVFYIARVEDSQNFTEKFMLRTLKPGTADGKTTWTTVKIGDKDDLSLELTGRPTDMRIVDANGDGVDDLLIFPASSEDPPLLLLGAAGNKFTAAPKAAQGTLGSITPTGVFFGKLDGNASSLLVAQNSFARKMKFETDGRWRVVDQFNAPSTTAKIAGVDAIDIDGDGSNELAMYDRTLQTVSFLKPRDGVWTRLNQLKVGAFALKGMRVADFNGDGKPDLLLFDADKMGIVYNGKTDIGFDTIATYESDERGGKLFDMVAGDLNHDGREDLLVIDQRKHNLEIVAVLPGNKLKRAQRWQVFEERTFRNLSGRNEEPREAVLGDVNGDGRLDIVCLVHDRVLVYLADPGTPSPAVPAGGNRAAATTTMTPTKTTKPTPSVASTPIRDEGNFFKPDTLVEAQAAMTEIKNKYRKDIVVETYATVPEPDAKRVRNMTSEGANEYFQKWAQSRSRELGVDGMYILICRTPAKVRYIVAKSSIPTTVSDKLYRTLMDALKTRQFDEGLLRMLKQAKDSLGNSNGR